MYKYKSFRDPIKPEFVQAAEVLLLRQKDPKPVTPRPASSDGTDANYGRADQLAGLKQGPQGNKSVHPWGRAAGVKMGRKKGAEGD